MKSHIDAMDHMLNDIFKKVFWEPLEHKEKEEIVRNKTEANSLSWVQRLAEIVNDKAKRRDKT